MKAFHSRTDCSRRLDGDLSERQSGRPGGRGQTRGRRIDRSQETGTPSRRRWPSRSPVPPRCGASRSRGGFTSCSRRTSSGAEPRLGPNWFRPQPFFAVDVENWKPGEPLRIGSRSDGFPGPLDEIKPGKYAIQAVVRLNLDTHQIGDGEGNAYGPVVHAELDPKRGEGRARGRPRGRAPAIQDDRPDQAGRAPQPEAVGFSSPTDQASRGRHLAQRDARRDRRPSCRRSTSFPASAATISWPRMAESPRTALASDFIRVVLDPDCGTGHHVFADSATNGPRGTALVEEFIPVYRAHVPGHRRSPRALAQRPFLRRLEQPLASGDLSRLFRRYVVDQPRPGRLPRFSTDQYLRTGENMFQDRDGKRRPIARMGGSPRSFTTGSPGWTT